MNSAVPCPGGIRDPTFANRAERKLKATKQQQMQRMVGT